MPDDHLAAALFATLLASQSLLVSVFGNIYSVYARFSTSGGATICRKLEILMYILLAVIVYIAVLACYSLYILNNILYNTIFFWMPWALSAIVVLVCVTPAVITYSLVKDASH